jgi:hypothetical protein
MSEFRSQAHRVAASLTKLRARAYARHPERLDIICRDLSKASPDDMIAFAARLLCRERKAPRRWFGFGGEVQALNARAIFLLGRARRRGAFAERRTAQAS